MSRRINKHDIEKMKNVGCMVTVCTNQRSSSEDPNMALEGTSEDSR